MCVKDGLGEDGFELWDAWGSQCQTHNASSAKAVWKSCKVNGKTTIASLFYDAKQRGWQDEKTYKKPTKAEIEARKAAAAARAALAAKEEAEAHAKAGEWAQRLWDAAQPCESHPYLERKGVASYGLRVGAWERIDEETGEVVVVANNALLLPLRDRQRKLWSLQAIFVDPNAKKLYLKGGAKAGNFLPIGKPQTHDGRQVFILGEGYATCASVHAATGHMVLVCFDKSNLLTVARSLRERLPDAWIVFAADNDTHTDGNPGVTAARKAAQEVGGLVAVPPPGDFNDMQLSEGLEAVAGAIAAAFQPAPEPDPEPEADVDFDGEPDAPAGDAPLVPSDLVPPDNLGDHLEGIDPSAYFTVLGYDRGEFYVFVHEQRQISVFRPGELSEANLLMIAPLEWWEFNFPTDGKGGGMNRKTVLNWFFRLAHARGIYDISRVRGRGAWFDDGRVVYHQGSCLYVDGVRTDVTKIKSKFVYELAKTEASPADVALTDEEGRTLLEISKRFRWSKPGAAALLAGWVFLAPVCGAIRWRPHIWLTGGAGSGKSTILNEYVSVCVGDAKVFAQGNSTEAGIRQKLKADALPVLFDESEQNDDAEKRRMAPILALIRQASTESVAQTYKGTISGDSMNFHIRSMFCLASIQAGMENKADQDRLTKLTLLKAQDDANASDNWLQIKEALYKLRRDQTLPSRLLRRAIDRLAMTQNDIETFVEAAAKHFGTQRQGDQYGTMMAGAWALCQSRLATPQEAMALIQSFDWDEFIDGTEMDDPEKALFTVLESKMSHKGEAFSVGSVIMAACGYQIDGTTLDQKLAGRLLREHGMDVEGAVLLFQNNSTALNKLVAGTKFENDLKSLLLRITGAKRMPAHRFAPGVVQRCVGVPLSLVLDDGPPI